MANGVKIRYTFQATDRVMKMLDTKEKEAKINKEMDRASREMLTLTRKNAPVKTGALKKNIVRKKVSDNKWEVRGMIWYDSRQEYGPKAGWHGKFTPHFDPASKIVRPKMWRNIRGIIGGRL